MIAELPLDMRQGPWGYDTHSMEDTVYPKNDVAKSFSSKREVIQTTEYARHEQSCLHSTLIVNEEEVLFPHRSGKYSSRQAAQRDQGSPVGS